MATNSLIRKALNATAHELARREFARIRADLQADIDQAELEGKSIDEQLAILRALSAPAREEGGTK